LPIEQLATLSNGDCVVLNVPQSTLDGVGILFDTELAEFAVVGVSLQHLLCDDWRDYLNGNGDFFWNVEFAFHNALYAIGVTANNNLRCEFIL